MKGAAVISALMAVFVLGAENSVGATAKCVVVEKKGTVLVMDCGARSQGFPEKGRVKIKTDRDKE
ncbi:MULTISPECIES: hypothetical protein [Desulfosediminicola]|uniref:hypothetical protein n=1 Tax=Desulfosediminicola TaxID=2886823 RepID=UPI0010AC9BA7|nr:hypothetical protein [Desulfosediminicola ganghwensis]